MKKLILVLFFVMISGVAFAHVPNVITFDRSRVQIMDPIESSRAFYATFEKSNDLDYYYFRLDEDEIITNETIEGLEGVEPLTVTDENGVTGRRLHLGTLVPGCEVYNNILPTVAVVGPLQKYIPAYDGDYDDLPFDVADDEGVLIISNEVQGPLWYEKFTFKSYYDQKKNDIIVTEKGKYKIYVWEPSGNTGDYVLETGPVEVFGFGEILQSIFWLEHLAQDGEIASCECEDQLEERDGPNPSILDLIDLYSGMF